MATSQLLSVNPATVESSIARLLEAERLFRDHLAGIDILYLPALYLAETYCTSRLLAHAACRYPAPAALPKKIRAATQGSDLEYSSQQMLALQEAATSGLLLLTGGPGTGKTTLVNGILSLYGQMGLRCVLCAPTGRAAKRMTESTGFAATTIHRLLKFQPQTRKFLYDLDNRLQGDVFILDESSMLDAALTRSFLNALPDTAVLIFVGDTDQLPSVGAGNVLADMIASGMIPCRHLTTIFRQDASGLIVRNAHHVNRGEPFEKPMPGDESDFYFMEAQDPQKIQEMLLKMMTQRIPAKFKFDPLYDVQVLTPMRRGELGTDRLNAIIQQQMNPNGETLWRGSTPFRKGDRVMQIANNYDKDVFNGDIGFVALVKEEDRSVTICFDGRYID
jgi:exodeoxyribonuclease V alpha subunit